MTWADHPASMSFALNPRYNPRYCHTTRSLYPVLFLHHTNSRFSTASDYTFSRGFPCRLPFPLVAGMFTSTPQTRQRRGGVVGVPVVRRWWPGGSAIHYNSSPAIMCVKPVNEANTHLQPGRSFNLFILGVYTPDDEVQVTAMTSKQRPRGWR